MMPPDGAHRLRMKTTLIEAARILLFSTVAATAGEVTATRQGDGGADPDYQGLHHYLPAGELEAKRGPFRPRLWPSFAEGRDSGG